MVKNSVDIETGRGGDQLYPGMTENPQMRWGFIRKVYTILCLQLLITFGVALAMFLLRPVREFMRTQPGLIVLICAIVLTFILCFLMSFFSQKHPWNYVFMFLFTISISVLIGTSCTQRKGEAVLLAAGLTLLITIALTLFTFFAAKQGYDFSFLGPFLMCALLLLIAFGLIRMFLPMGKVVRQVIACIGALVFSAFIIYDTDNLIKRFNYDEYISAAASLYLDILNLFLNLLTLFLGRDD